MIIFVAGMPRSGSTFSFNIVRELLSARGRVHQVPTESLLSALEALPAADHLLVKGHAADPATIALIRLGAIKVVCTTRVPEDAIASWMDTFGFDLDQSVSVMQRWFAMYHAIAEHALLVPFSTIDRDPLTAARDIARHVCPDAREAEVAAIARRFTKAEVAKLSQRVADREGAIEDLGFSRYDRTTFFHRRHVTSLTETKASERIGGEQIASIRASFAADCDAHGNLR